MPLIEWIITVLVLQLILTFDTCKCTCIDDLDFLSTTTRSFITIEENSPVDFLIYNVTTDNSLQLASPHPFIKVENGSLFTSKNLTWDGDVNKAVCISLTKDETNIHLKLNCTGSRASARDFNIILNYSDDFDPTFPESINREFSVKEHSSVGTVVVDLSVNSEYSASDQDCGTNNYIYSVQTDVFRYSPTIKAIVVLKELDYERQKEYHFNLTVMSTINSQSYRSATTPITIIIEDVDDEKPEFDFIVYTLKVQEGTDLSNQSLEATPVIQAHDGDLGINETIYYSIDSQPSDLNITIDNVTAKVNILTQLDREVKSEYSVTIRATQVNNDLMTTTALLRIEVEDINDHWPKFTNQITDITISEITETNSYLVLMNARDDDQGENAKFECEITSDDLSAFGLKYDNATSRFWLTVSNASALRGKMEGHVKVHLKEKTPAIGSPCTNISECSTEITVHILDYNDNTPTFGVPLYEFTIFSNSPGNWTVGKIEATDLDRGDNARISYSLKYIPTTTDCSKVVVNERSGEMTISKPITVNTTCYFLANACDNPLDSLSKRCASVSVTVKVIEGTTGGNSTVEVYDVTIPENIPLGTLVTVLPIAGLITNSTEFRTDHDSIFTNTVIDRERKDLYRLVFVNAEHVDSLILNIHVDDVNDNPPVFASHIYSLNVLDDAQIGQTVLQVNASDADLKNNAALSFSIFGGSPWFSINPDSGSVQLVKLWPSASEMVIIVRDKGIPSLQDMATVKISGPSPNQTAVVILPVAIDSLNSDQKGLRNKLSSILGVDIKIHDIESLNDVPDMGSRVKISARRKNGEQLGIEEIESLIKAHAKEIYSSFKEDTKSADVWTTPFIAVLVIGIFLFLLLIIFVILLKRQRTKYKRTNRLFEKLNRDTTIYDAAHNKAISPQADTNGSTNGSNLQNGSLPASRSLTSNVFENPAYRHDDTPDIYSHDGHASRRDGDANLWGGNTRRRDGDANLWGGDASPRDGDANLWGGDASSQDGDPSSHDGDSHSVEAPHSDYVDVAISSIHQIDVEDENRKETKQESPRVPRASQHGSSLISEVQRVTEPVHKTMINVKMQQMGPSNQWDPDPTNPDYYGTKFSNQFDRRNSEADSGVPGDVIYDGDDGDDDGKEDADGNQKYVPTVNPYNTTHQDLLDPGLDLVKQDSAAEMNNLVPDEPEPDYAKKVRFNDKSATAFHTDDKVVNRFDEEIPVPNTVIEDPFYFGESEMTAL